jgi:hypothetical protein
MFRKRLLWGIGLSLLTLMSAKDVQSQTLSIDPPRQHIANRPFNGVETLTLNLVVDFGIQDAVAWGTDITLADTATLEFVPDFGGAGTPFKSTQPFFDTDFSDYSDAGVGDGDAILHLNFLNFADPDATFGQAGRVTLGQFQVRVKQEPNYPGDANFGGAILLSDLGSPPFGTAVQDMDGNNLLISVGSAAITSRPPTPEPSAWLTMLLGTSIGALLLRRKAAKQTTL